MRRNFATFLILLISLSMPLNSQTSNDIRYGKLIFNKLYNTEFDSAEVYIEQYAQSDPYNISPKLFHLMLKQGRLQDLESINMSESDAFFKLCESFIELALAEKTIDDSWRNYLIGYSYFLQSAEKKRISENLDAIQMGYDGLDYMEKAVKENEALNDALIGVGVFKYWKSVYTLWIPFFSDEREDAFVHFKNASKGSFYFQEALDYQLIFIYIEEEKFEKAQKIIEKWTVDLPNSRLFQWAGAYLYRKTNQFDKAYFLYSQLYDYYINTESIVNQLELLKKRAFCLNELDKKKDALLLLADLKLLNHKDYDHPKVNDKVREINDLSEAIKR